MSVLLVALLVCVTPWLYGGASAPALLSVMPWLVALALEALVFFPQRHGDETSYQARARVWRELRRDPLAWLSVALLVLLAIPFANKGLCPGCDAAAIASGLSADPPVKYLPFCVNRLHHLGVFFWFLPALVAALATKHAMTKDGKLVLLELVIWNGALLAAVGALQLATGAPGPFWIDPGRKIPYFFATFGYPNMGGDYFTTIFLLAAGLWYHRQDVVREEESRIRLGSAETGHGSSHSRFWRRHYLLIPMVLSFVGAINTLSRASILLVGTGAGIVLVYGLLSSLQQLKSVLRMKAGAAWALAIVLVGIAAVVFTPKTVRTELDTVGTHVVLERVTGKHEGHTARAMALWRDAPIFGCGGWGYMHLSPKYIREGEMLYPNGMANVHNDYLQFLCEHGLVGFGLLAGIAGLLLVPLARTWRQLARSVRFMDRRERPPHPAAVFVLPAGAFFTLLAAVATLVHAFADCPMRSAAVFILFFVEIAALDGYLPYLPGDDDTDKD